MGGGVRAQVEVGVERGRRSDDDGLQAINNGREGCEGVRYGHERKGLAFCKYLLPDSLIPSANTP